MASIEKQRHGVFSTTYSKLYMNISQESGLEF